MLQQSAEEHYLARLESARATWWSSGNFDTWKRLYQSEYPRGFLIIETLRKYAPDFKVRGSRVLDIGCGDAGAIIAFAEEGASAAGIELNDTSLQRGKLRAEDHNVRIELKKAVAEDIPFEDASFDLVMLDNVLEHVTDRPKTLQEVRRVLKPGGLLYMVTPKPLALYNIWSDPHFELAGLVLMPRSMQLWYFEKIRGGGKGNYCVGLIPTRRKAQSLLRDAGFRVLVSPRELWINYLRHRVASPENVRPGIKRKISEYVSGASWAFNNPVMRWMWDILMGSNFFIARVEQ